MERKYTCCFTGHRPEKLPWGDNELDPRCLRLKQSLYDTVESAYQKGMRRFICGMARGCDFYFAETVLALREKYLDIELEAAIPYPGQAKYWSEDERARWRGLVEACDDQKVLQPAYSRGCLLRRNRYMVDQSALVIAAYNGQGGGTMQTLAYAMQTGVDFVDIGSAML